MRGFNGNKIAAPHHGGLWERLVRGCKRFFCAVNGTRRLTDEMFAPTFCLVEQSLNARPISPVGSDSTELEALTPNLFLLGEHSVSFPSTPESAM